MSGWQRDDPAGSRRRPCTRASADLGFTVPLAAARRPSTCSGLCACSSPANYNPAPAQATYNPAPAATGAGQFTSDQQARARCPSDTVVWVNTRSRIYHFAGTRDYGNTKQGAYMCEADARSAGDRAAMNEKHP